MKRMISESVDGFGLPVDEAKEPNFEKLLKKLYDAASKHLELMLEPKEGEEDPLPNVLEKVKEVLEPQDEPAPEEMPVEEPAPEEVK